MAMKGAFVSEEAHCLRRAATGAVFGAGTTDRTAIFRAHRPSGRERSEAASSQAPYRSFPPYRRKLTHFAARPFPTRTATLTFAREPCSGQWSTAPKPKTKTFLFHRPRRLFFGTKKSGGGFAWCKAPHSPPPKRRNLCGDAPLSRCQNPHLYPNPHTVVM